jgi:hypothetical protein
MATDKPETKSLRSVDTEEMVDELLDRMRDIGEDDARMFKRQVMKMCGYIAKPTYVKPTKTESRKGSGFFGGGKSSNDDDDEL